MNNPTPVVVALMYNNDTESVYMLKHKERGWVMPGGKVDINDLSVETALTREVKEETGLILNEAHDATYLCSSNVSGQGQYMCLYFIVDCWVEDEDLVSVQEPDTFTEGAWISASNIRHIDMWENDRQIIIKYLEEEI